jgi:hypothetical protein
MHIKLSYVLISFVGVVVSRRAVFRQNGMAPSYGCCVKIFWAINLKFDPGVNPTNVFFFFFFDADALKSRKKCAAVILTLVLCSCVISHPYRNFLQM